MTQCLCLKTDGKQCSREASKKSDKNGIYCWQHQKCLKPQPKKFNLDELSKLNVSSKPTIESIDAPGVQYIVYTRSSEKSPWQYLIGACDFKCANEAYGDFIDKMYESKDERIIDNLGTKWIECKDNKCRMIHSVKSKDVNNKHTIIHMDLSVNYQ